MAQVVSMKQLLESGVHFGHQTRRWNPKMKRYIFTERNGIYIIDLQQSLDYIDRAYEFIKETVAHGGTILYVGTKKQAQEAIAEQARRVGMPFVNQRWLGGMLTNFSTVYKRLQRLKELEEIDFDDVAASGMTKKELLHLRREHDKLDRTLGGIRDMARVPSAIWVVDTKKEHIAVNEARKLGIPVVAILDTNCDPDEVNYPIPGNDDAIRSVALLTRVVADAVAEGLIARAGAAGGDEKPAGAARHRGAAGRVGARAAGGLGEPDCHRCYPRGRRRGWPLPRKRAADAADAEIPADSPAVNAAPRPKVPPRRRDRCRGPRYQRGRRCGRRGRRPGGRRRRAGRRAPTKQPRARRSNRGHRRRSETKDEDMANFTAADVKRLREQTGAGMMDCKNALDEADGDFEAAIEVLRLKGAKDVNKRATRTAANGLVTAELDGTSGRRARRAELRDGLRGQDGPVPAGGRRDRRAPRWRPASPTGWRCWPPRPGRAPPSSSSSRKLARA